MTDKELEDLRAEVDKAEIDPNMPMCSDHVVDWQKILDEIPEKVHCKCGFDGTAEDLEWDDDGNGLCPDCGAFL